MNHFSSRSPSPPSDSPGRLKIFYNFASRSPILMIFTFLKLALKFIGSSSLLKECGSRNKGATDAKRNENPINFKKIALIGASYMILYLFKILLWP